MKKHETDINKKNQSKILSIISNSKNEIDETNLKNEIDENNEKIKEVDVKSYIRLILLLRVFREYVI